ncbi:hypothetical protein FF38_09342, partial [Lucilia cuprina]
MITFAILSNLLAHVVAGPGEQYFYELEVESSNKFNNNSYFAYMLESNTNSPSFNQLLSNSTSNQSTTSNSVVFDTKTNQLIGANMYNLDPWYYNVMDNGTISYSFNESSQFGIEDGYLTYNGKADQFSACVYDESLNFINSLNFNANSSDPSCFNLKLKATKRDAVYPDYYDAMDYEIYGANIKVESETPELNNEFAQFVHYGLHGISPRHGILPYGSYQVLYNQNTREIRAAYMYGNVFPFKIATNEGQLIGADVCAKDVVKVDKYGYLSYKGHNDRFHVSMNSKTYAEYIPIYSSKNLSNYATIKLKIVLGQRVNPLGVNIPQTNETPIQKEGGCSKTIQKDSFLKNDKISNGSTMISISWAL